MPSSSNSVKELSLPDVPIKLPDFGIGICSLGGPCATVGLAFFDDTELIGETSAADRRAKLLWRREVPVPASGCSSCGSASKSRPERENLFDILFPTLRGMTDMLGFAGSNFDTLLIGEGCGVTLLYAGEMAMPIPSGL